jgi:hypothetical protein
MPGDPKECRLRAVKCMQLANETTNLELRRTFVDLAHHWNRIAAELDDAQALLNVLNQVTDDTSSPSQHIPAPSPNP